MDASSLQYDRESQWIRVVTPEYTATGQLRVLSSLWQRICTTPDPVAGFEIEKDDKRFRLGAAIASVIAETVGDEVHFDTAHFVEVKPIVSERFIFLGASNEREVDRAAADALAETWGVPPLAIQTGWEIDVTARVRNVSGASYWTWWSQIVVSTPATLIVPVDVDLGRATLGVVRKVLFAGGRRVITPETPPRDVVRVAGSRAVPRGT